MILEFCQQISEKYSNTKFNKNPFIGSRVQWRRTDGKQTDGRTWQS